MKIDKEKCLGCGLCVKSCIFGCIKMEENYPVIDETCCNVCGVCINDCPVQAIETGSTKHQGKIDLTRYKGIFVLAEMDKEMIRGVSLELLSKARELADKIETKVTAVVFKNNISTTVEKRISATGCDRLLQIKNKKLDGYNTDLFAELAEKTINKYKPEIVLIPGTICGRDLAPRIASRLKTGLTADCTGLEIDSEGNMLQIRPTYGGNIMATIITPNHRPQMATVRPKVMQIMNSVKREIFCIETEDIKAESNINRCLLINKIEKEFPFNDLSEANVVVAGGYGMQNSENFKLIYKLATILNATPGATRKVVDEGWAPVDIQVGQTGKNVAPNVYIAFGISGALQHTIGIKNAKKIIAINNNPTAPIFSLCDVAILGDATEVIKSIISKIEA